jgi:hypothetical protein
MTVVTLFSTRLLAADVPSSQQVLLGLLLTRPLDPNCDPPTEVGALALGKRQVFVLNFIGGLRLNVRQNGE